MRRASSGFTLIELMIVISIIGVLAAVLLPQVIGSQDEANVAADQMQLRTHYTWFQFHKTQAKGLPTEGGHKFVLSTWKIVDKTEENFDKYFTPGARDNDPTWREKRKLIERGENPWPDLGSTTSEDTTYAGRAKEHLRTVEQGGGEAWMANDNEGYWSHRNGSVNILLADGNVRSMSYLKLQELFSLPEMDKENPVVTVGPNSPIDVCRKLAH